MSHRTWCNADSWCERTDSDKHYRLNQPPAVLLLSRLYRSTSDCLRLTGVLSLWPVCGPLIVAFLSLHPLRWAQFFICPLMIRDAIDREVEAVDSGESRRISPPPRWEVKFQLFLELNFYCCSFAHYRFPLVVSSFYTSPSVCQSTSWRSRRTPTGRRCCLAVWPNLDTLWASSAGVSW